MRHTTCLWRLRRPRRKGEQLAGNLTALTMAGILAACGTTGPTSPGSTQTDPMGPETTGLVSVYGRIMRMAMSQSRLALDISYDPASGTFTGNPSSDYDLWDLSDYMNYLAPATRTAIGERWQAITADSAALFEAMAPDKVSDVEISYAGHPGSWLTERQSGLVYHAPVNQIAWTAGSANAGMAVHAPMQALVADLSDIATDGDLTQAIDLSEVGTDGAGRYWVTHDPPTDGTTPTKIVGSHPGSAGIPIGGGGVSCMPTAGSYSLGQSCVQAPFGATFPNYTNPTETDNSGTQWLSFVVASAGKCPSGFQCSLNATAGGH